MALHLIYVKRFYAFYSKLKIQAIVWVITGIPSTLSAIRCMSLFMPRELSYIVTVEVS
jgi:hypothetical protein